jgi:hypothetical protein
MELIVALALMVIVIGIVYSFIHFFNNSFARGGDQFQLHSNIRNASDFITDEIRNATEIEIVTVPITADAFSQYIYIENNTIKHYKEGAVSDKSENIISNASRFTIRKDDSTGRYYVAINLQGIKNGEEYDLSTEILLNNIKSVTGSLSGTAIRYKK